MFDITGAAGRAQRRGNALGGKLIVVMFAALLLLGFLSAFTSNSNTAIPDGRPGYDPAVVTEEQSDEPDDPWG